MKKHIIGFAIFSLIVGSAALVSAFFAPRRAVIVVPAVETIDYAPMKKSSCWKMKREVVKTKTPGLSIVQARFDLNTKQLNWQLTTPQTESPIALHFFVKNSQGMRYLATEVIEYPALFEYSNESGNVEFVSSYQWLDDLDSYQNLYVVPEEISRSMSRSRNFQPVFDKDAATPVSVYAGKTSKPTITFSRK